MSEDEENVGDKTEEQSPIVGLIGPPPAPPPLIERLKKEATEATQVPNSEIFYFFGQSHLIGRGASCYGVFKGYHQHPEKKAAVKLVYWNDETDLNELNIWKEISSHDDHDKPGFEYLVNLYEFTPGLISLGDNQTRILYICMELATCSLEQELSYSKDTRIDLPNYINYLKNIFLGLEYLHDHEIIHRDIKPQNILLFENPTTGQRIAKLGDFGLSRLLSQAEGSMSLGKGTKMWMSPEALRASDEEEEFLNTKSMDIFSLGLVTYYTLYFKRHPFEMNEKLLVNIKDPYVTPDEKEMHYIANQSTSAQHLVMWMLQKDPKNRPTIQQCNSHPFLWGNETEKVLQFFNDVLDIVMWVPNGDDDEENLDPAQQNITNISHCVNYAVTSHYRELMRKTPNSIQRDRPWNWKMDVDSQLLETYSLCNQDDGYNGFSAMSLLKFVRDKLRNRQDLPEEVVKSLFSIDGTVDGFCQEMFTKYFLELYPQMPFLFFFIVARIAQDYPHLQKLQEDYFQEFVNCPDKWSHGVISDCLEKLFKRIEFYNQYN